jgi:hypothetical protein
MAQHAVEGGNDPQRDNVVTFSQGERKGVETFAYA